MALWLMAAVSRLFMLEGGIGGGKGNYLAKVGLESPC